MHKYAESADNGAREVQFGPLNGGSLHEHRGVGSVQTSRISGIQDDFFNEALRFGKVYQYCTEKLFPGQMTFDRIYWE